MLHPDSSHQTSHCSHMFSLKYKADSTYNFKTMPQFSILFRIELEVFTIFYGCLNCLWRSFPTTTQHHSYLLGSSTSAPDIIKHFVSWNNFPTSEPLPMLAHLRKMLFSTFLHPERPHPAFWTQEPISQKCVLGPPPAPSHTHTHTTLFNTLCWNVHHARHLPSSFSTLSNFRLFVMFCFLKLSTTRARRAPLLLTTVIPVLNLFPDLF